MRRVVIRAGKSRRVTGLPRLPTSVPSATLMAILVVTLMSVRIPAALGHDPDGGHLHPRPDTIVVPEVSLQRLLERSELLDQYGQRFTIPSLAGRPLLVSFFFTDCVDVCPTQTASLRQVQRELASTGSERNMRLLSISLAPNSDTPERLLTFARRYAIDHERWVFATAEPGTIDELASAFWIDANPLGNGQIDHRMIVHLLDSNLQPVQRYRADPLDIEYLAREIQALIQVETRRLEDG